MEQFFMLIDYKIIVVITPLFEAKAAVLDQYALYNIFRLDSDKYRAELISDKNEEYHESAPRELIISKNNGLWQTEDKLFEELVTTIGVEIDAFNNGYGALLGRIGVK